MSARKIFRRILIIPLAVTIAIFLSLTFIIKFRIKSVLKEVVLRETGGAYQLDFTSISLSLVKGTVMLRSTDLKPTERSRNKGNYRLKIAGLYFSLGSWKELLFHRKLFIDSLEINGPDIGIFHAQAQKKGNAALQLQEIYSSLKDISERLKVRVLEIHDGDIRLYEDSADAVPLLISNIDFRIENFGQKGKEKTKLRYSDDMAIHISGQHWMFSSGQSISFKNLSFSGREQFFQVDSCSIKMLSVSGEPATSLYADKLLFKANELSSIFEKNELNIDTLYCKSPILSFALPGNRGTKNFAYGLNEFIHQLLGNVDIQFMNIENGQIQLTSSDGNRSYTSQKTNLKVYRLNIDHDHFPHIRVGSIDLHLDEVSFAGSDSLYLLTVKEFGLDGDNLVCRNAFLKPSPKAPGYLSGVNLPAFTLVNVSLEDLLEKKFSAQSAVIERPQVRFIAGVVKKTTAEQGLPVGRFYDALNGLARMIDVHWLTIKDGEFEYYSPLSGMNKLSIKDIDVEINLDDLLRSSSPLATKRSIHSMRIGNFNLTSGSTNIELKNFFLNGDMQIGNVESLRYDLESGIALKGENIYWERFSWGDFVKDKRIDMSLLDIGQLYFTAVSGDDHASGKKERMPRINLNKLHIRESFIAVSKKNNTAIRAIARNIVLGQLAHADGIWSWNNLGANLQDISFRDDNRQVSIQQMNVSGNGESIAEDVVYSEATTLGRIPLVKFQLNINSSNFSSLNFAYLSIYRPRVMIGKSSHGFHFIKKNKSAGLMPFDVQNLEIIDGYFSFQSPGKPINLSSRFSAKIGSAGTEDDTGSVVFDKAILKFDSILVKTEKFPATLDNLHLTITKGLISRMNNRGPSLAGILNGQWKSLALTKPTKNGFIEFSNVSGGIEDFPFSIGSGGKNSQIEDIVESMSLKEGRFFYADSVTTASVSNIRGSGKEGTLELKGIEIKPKATVESFFKTSQSQRDYLTFNCESIELKKIDKRAFLEDTAVFVQSIYLHNPLLSTYRDKNIAFRHGIEKHMPTKLISAIKIPVRVDSVCIKGASIDIHEISAITKREGVVPLRNVEALFKNIINRPGGKDSLSLEISGRVLDYNIRKFSYAESYGDSLSGFKMNYSFSPMHLPALTEISNPLSAIAVTNGRADTLYARVSGNKYASFGEMNFYYRQLRIRLLSKEDTLKKNFLLALETLVTNGFVIKSKNKKQASMFFIRDREKFVFNYWIKTLFSGLLTSTGVKRNGKYRKMHDDLEKKYLLPASNE